MRSLESSSVDARHAFPLFHAEGKLLEREISVNCPIMAGLKISFLGVQMVVINSEYLKKDLIFFDGSIFLKPDTVAS